MMKHKTLTVSLLVMALWGLLFSLVKLGYQAFGLTGIGDILTFAGFRFFICGIVITGFALVRSPESFNGQLQNIPRIFAIGLFSVVLHYGFSYIGLNLTGSGKTAILKQLGAVFFICFSHLFFKDDKLTGKKLIALLLGVLGIVAINLRPEGLRFQLGDILIILASFCTVIANVISKKAPPNTPPIVLTGISQLFGGVLLLIAGICANGSILAVIPQTSDQFAVFLPLIATSCVSYCLWFAVVQKEDLSRLFIIKFTEPIFAAIFGWLLLGEDIFNLNYAAAFLLISAGITVGNWKKRTPSAK